MNINKVLAILVAMAALTVIMGSVADARRASARRNDRDYRAGSQYDQEINRLEAQLDQLKAEEKALRDQMKRRQQPIKDQIRYLKTLQKAEKERQRMIEKGYNGYNYNNRTFVDPGHCSGKRGSPGYGWIVERQY